MKNTLIFLVGLGLASVIGVYFAKRELRKFLEDLDTFHDQF